MEDALDHVVYSKEVIEFVTVAKEYCNFIETSSQYSRQEFVTIATRILPLTYLKASLLPQVDFELDEAIEKTVDEMTYVQVRESLNFKLGRFSDYLEVFTEDMKHSDTPVIAFISEDLSDIYQDLKDFVFAYRLGVNEIMNDALAELMESFRNYWGQKLVNTLRALHAILYNSEEPLDEEEGEDESLVKKNVDNWFNQNFLNTAVGEDDYL